MHDNFQTLTPHLFILKDKFIATKLLDKKIIIIFFEKKIMFSNFRCYIYLKIYYFSLVFNLWLAYM